MEDLIYLDKHKVLLKRQDETGYTPIAYNVTINDEGEFEGTEIYDGDIIFDWIIYVKKSMQDYSKKTNKVIQGNLYAWQWGLSIEFINDVMSFNADMWDISISRQSGRVLPF